MTARARHSKGAGRPRGRRAPRARWLLAAAALLAIAGAVVWLSHASGNAGEVLHFRSRPELHPPAVEVMRATARDDAAGDVFLAAKDGPGQSGPMIVDGHGRLLWFRPMAPNRVAFDFRVQRYRGARVLTWWQGRVVDGHGVGEGVIADSHYHVIARVHAAKGETADLHELQLTPRGTALITVYRRVHRDLTPWGGAADGIVDDSIVQEIDIATGRLVYEWHSLDHVPLGESLRDPPSDGSDDWDYFHINSIAENRDGDLLVSARNTSTVYKIDRATGAVDWRLGGKRSSFEIAPAARFVSQHDAGWAAGGDVTLFDNAAPPTTDLHTRALRIHLDLRRHRATLVHAYEPPEELVSDAQGSVQPLAGGDVFVGWGSDSPSFSEFTAGGRIRFDARFVGSDVRSYRAYRMPWKGWGAGRPAVAARTGSAGAMTVFASFNGATEVARWRVLAGGRHGRLRAVASRRWDGFETAIRLPHGAARVAVVALDRHGRALGRSKTIRG